ncbi:conserved hypothetical protein [Leishmania braziliensis MHOM/BR/75/M2904]|uniref:PH-like domain-containing protein n=2 Tax=Leishmania braziliensis TaxID=5660 RepID=A4H361_LEIBR|nr:conserved hypothetical protein [Leishmania braziliensis MHOM/BR/75/M2904]CAJ2465621.1 unnamed protein product [Leishmania braziliensis]CAM36468.1 conserved hypothetical protein [Leishmania braziliensis MHOM/BR/75/M2904]SYZ62331.1 hypothetical_protein [Leishmania braziliensis MHOM/BR/75/M2904]
MCSLETLLCSPADLIAECPVIGPSDVRLVAANFEAILNKCLYCVRLKLPTPLRVLLTIIGDAGELQANKVCLALLQPTEEGTCVDVFCDLAAQLLGRRAAVLRLQFDVEVLFQVMQLFCCAASLKDRLGARLGEVLLGFMRDTDMHADDYRVPRNCCGALISLLRGSRENKNRFGPECATIAACLDASSDFFFQMQCVEVLYRLYKHRSSFLTQAATPAALTSVSSAPANERTASVALHSYLLRGIEGLPNDSTLLHCIHQLLDNYNSDVHPDKIRPFAVLHIDVAGVTVARATTLYFSPLLLVARLPDNSSSSSGGNYLTIPFEHVRSVKLTKDHKLELRLYVIPAKLSHVMSVTQDGMDKLHVSMTRATMRELRTSVVHQWVAERKRTAPRRVVAPVPTDARQREAARAVHTLPAPSSTPPTPPSSSQTSSRIGSTMRPPLTATITERPVNTLQGGDMENQQQPPACGKLQPPQCCEAVQQRQAQHELGGPARMSRSSDYAAADEEAGEQCKRSCLAEVHHAASVKAMRYREEQHEALQHAVDSAKEALEELHRWSARERDQYEARFREDMEVIRRSEAVLKESATDCVQALNTELEDVQALGALLKGEVEKLRERLAKSLGKSEGIEEALLARIKQTVDAQMRSMEETMLSVGLSASSPAGVGSGAIGAVSQYITEHMQAISSGAVVVGTAGARPSTAAAGSAVRSAGRGTRNGRAEKVQHPQQPQPLKERRLDFS